MLLLKLKYLQNQKLNINKFIINFVEMDLIASEFKLHKEPKMLTRPVRPQTDTTRGDLIGNFDKLVSHIDWHITGIDNPLGMRKAVKLYLGCDIDEASGESIKKRRQEKTKFLDYWLKVTFKLLRRKNISFINTYWYFWCNNKCLTFIRSIYVEGWLWPNCYNCC